MRAWKIRCAHVRPHFKKEAAVLLECFEPEIVFYTPDGEFVGRKKVLAYLREHFFHYTRDPCYRMTPHEVQVFGDALWYSYDYSIEMPQQTLNGYGFAMCRRSGKRWLVVNLHNSLRNRRRKR